jgi:hypothetical protein
VGVGVTEGEGEAEGESEGATEGDVETEGEGEGVGLPDKAGFGTIMGGSRGSFIERCELES